MEMSTIMLPSVTTPPKKKDNRTTQTFSVFEEAKKDQTHLILKSVLYARVTP